MSVVYAAIYFTLAYTHSEAGQLDDARKALAQADKAMADAGVSVDSTALEEAIDQLSKQTMAPIEAEPRSESPEEEDSEEKTGKPEVVKEFQPPPIIQSLRRLPVLGKIPAGPFMLIEDRQSIIGNIWVDKGKAARADYALLVKGNSMQGASINSGDYALIREQPRAEKGDIVAALVMNSGDEVALKHFDYDDAYVYLYSETKDGREVAHRMKKQEAIEGLWILGKVVSVIPASAQEG
ncbi:MAG: S24 family peptidase [Chloroflexota bacterium]|nr:S24 family peptidase [Chloroflexota bacterium]